MKDERKYKIILLVAYEKENYGIGYNKGLPWHLPKDLKFFKDITTGHHIIMGRKTYESIGKPLPNRTNIVVTSQPDFMKNSNYSNLIIKHSLNKSIEYAAIAGEKEIFVIGGAEIFRQVIKKADKIYVTEVVGNDIKVDAYFSQLRKMREWKEDTDKRNKQPADEKNKYDIVFKTYLRKKKKNINRNDSLFTEGFDIIRVSDFNEHSINNVRGKYIQFINIITDRKNKADLFFVRLTIRKKSSILQNEYVNKYLNPSIIKEENVSLFSQKGYYIPEDAELSIKLEANLVKEPFTAEISYAIMSN